jgi:hypothetical protein
LTLRIRRSDSSDDFHEKSTKEARICVRMNEPPIISPIIEKMGKLLVHTMCPLVLLIAGLNLSVTETPKCRASFKTRDIAKEFH